MDEPSQVLETGFRTGLRRIVSRNIWRSTVIRSFFLSNTNVEIGIFWTRQESLARHLPRLDDFRVPGLILPPTHELKIVSQNSRS